MSEEEYRMTPQWLIARDGEEIGKASSAELKEMARAGTLLPSDHVWRDGMKEWQVAEQLPNLFVAPSPPPPPQSSRENDTGGVIRIDTSSRRRPLPSKASNAAPAIPVSPTVCWVMIGAGALDLIGWLMRGYGWTNVLFGDNFLTQYGPWLLIAIGVGLLQQQPSRSK